MTRRIRFDGACNDFQYWSTPSWSRGSNIRHDIVICKRSGIVSCTCESHTFTREHKRHQIFEGEGGCKHILRLRENLKRVIREGIDTALYA